MTSFTLRYLATKLPVGVSEDSVHSESKSAEETDTHTHTLKSMYQIDLRPLEERDMYLRCRLAGNALGMNGGVVQPACRETLHGGKLVA